MREIDKSSFSLREGCERNRTPTVCLNPYAMYHGSDSVIAYTKGKYLFSAFTCACTSCVKKFYSSPRTRTGSHSCEPHCPQYLRRNNSESVYFVLVVWLSIDRREIRCEMTSRNEFCSVSRVHLLSRLPAFAMRAMISISRRVRSIGKERKDNKKNGRRG